MTVAIRLLIVDDACLYREGLASALSRETWATAVCVAGDSVAALHQLALFRPDVVLLNMATIGALAIVASMIKADPKIRVVALGVSEVEDEVITYAEAGVAGYLLRGQSLAELTQVVQSVARGETLCTPRTAATLLRRVATLARAAHGRSQLTEPNVGHLTARERQIVVLIDKGLSNEEIASCLSIEVCTVKNHVHNILEKLQVSRRGEAAARMRAVLTFGGARHA